MKRTKIKTFLAYRTDMNVRKRYVECLVAFGIPHQSNVCNYKRTQISLQINNINCYHTVTDCVYILTIS